MEKYFKNPILSGFYPDPSICRAGKDYYLATSSFVYYPGLPIFHSTDLVNWEQIGHGISRPNQLDYKDCETSLGLWAPTLRHHQGTWYLINTFVSGGREAKRENFILTAERPEGPWSDPVFIKGADGIDPSLFFDEEGRMWYTGNFIIEKPLYEGHHGIYLCELDPVSFQIKGERRVIWDGSLTRSHWIEAPHLYKRGNYYYLMVAEGGTFVDHSVMMARATTVEGPYEPCPRNPILTHRHMSMDAPISVVGHGDLIETQNGEWWMVVLGIRTYRKTHFNTGRETFLVPMRWEEDGWPMVDNEEGRVKEWERRPQLPEQKVPPVCGSDQFENDQLAWCWNTIHPPKEPFYSLTERKGFLRLYLRPQTMEEVGCPAFVGRRQQHKSFLARTALDFVPTSAKEECGLALVQDDRYHYLFLCGGKETSADARRMLRLYRCKGKGKELVGEREIGSGRIYLTVFCTGETYEFFYGFQEGQMERFGDGQDAALLSSDVNEGFTGAYLGMYGTSGGMATQGYGDFDWFVYQGE